MIKRRAIARMVRQAQQAGATHLFVARDQLDSDRLYGIRVMCGEDPHEVHENSDDWLLECYVLQDDSIPVHVQLAERRAWHLEPRSRAATATATAGAELAELQAVVVEYRQAWAFTVSGANHTHRRDTFEAARGQLIAAARAAYDEGSLTPYQIRSTTGLTRAQVAGGSSSWVSPPDRGSGPVVDQQDGPQDHHEHQASAGKPGAPRARASACDR
ncbi:hypothetical protein ACIA49_38775 [Kribbella sp. NPDC051587]|uniref:hypothetical protein n=1 Tax=Kribbella sp. NPDC051587 TaxID=3364119 RepID=UPI00379CF432